MIKIDKGYYDNVKKIFDKVKFNYFTGAEINKANFVSSFLDESYNKISLFPQKTSLAYAISYGVEGMHLFGDEALIKIGATLSTVDILENPYLKDEFQALISYGYDEEEEKIIPETGGVLAYVIPGQLDDLAPIWMSHENIHALKDTNYEEYKNAFIYGEVIPLFYEMLKAHELKILTKSWFVKRMQFLISSKKEFQKNLSFLQDNQENKEDVLINCSLSGNYLNDFYYALVLYRLYLDEPALILDLIRRVLLHEITTEEMLDIMGIKEESFDNLFTQEFQKLKKIL